MSIDFTQIYDRSNALSFLRDDFLPEDFTTNEEDIHLSFTTGKLQKAHLLGEVPSLDLKVYEFTHKSESDPRATITKEAFRFLANRGEQRALVFFISENSPNYRFSLITIDLKPDGKKIEKIISNPKRYSYYLGPNAKINTPTKYLIKRNRVIDFRDLRARFSIEVVNKEFFEQISKYFMRLAGGKRGKEDFKDGELILPSNTEHIKKQEFVVRLIGRIIFCWFLKKKVSENNISLIPEELLSSTHMDKGYYHNVLEPLFFEVLNKPIEQRNQKYRNKLFDTIPFLNGGLFEAHDDDYYDPDKVLFISKYISTLKIPDDWFKSLFETLETYNFTIDENTSTDIDLSVDPEMLGRIFENLLAEINPETGETTRKSTGSYYTPREIVDYMVGKSLKYYLLEKTKISEEKIDQLIQDTFDNIDLNEEERKDIIDAFSSLKVIDPACGSGAFPMGILQKIVSILQEIDPYSKLWLEKQLEKIPDITLRNLVRQKLDKETINYIFKLGLIQNSIYGVDIQEIAVELSKLRVFLSLIVDAYVDDLKENRGVEPLPNLEFKFVCANSLIDLPPEKIYLVDNQTGYSGKIHDELKKLREEYFGSFGKEKEQIREKFREKQGQLFDIILKWGKGMEDKKSFMLSEWDPFSDKPSSWFNPDWMFGIKDGFDIVIANPPYVRQERIKEYKPLLEKAGYKVYNSSSDLYTYFYEKGYDLLKNNGILVFISSNKWMRARYGEKLRKFIKENTEILEVIDFGGQKVFDATVDTNIMIFKVETTRRVVSTLKRQSNIKKDNNEKMIYKENTFNGINVQEDFEIGTGIYDYVRNNFVQLKQNEIDEKTFLIADDAVLSLKAKIEKIGKPLKDWDVKIFRGVLTGFNEAFIISTEKRNKILSNCRTKEERNRTEEIIKPILKGRDIGKYYYRWNGLWLILSNRGLDITKYPSIFEYFDVYKERLRKKAGSNRWYELQASPSSNKIKSIESPKIIYSDIGFRFAYDNKAFYLDNTAYFIEGLKNENLIYLLGILNSNLIKYYYATISSELSKTTTRSFNIYIEKIPIPPITSQTQHIAKQIEELVEKINVETTRRVVSTTTDTTEYEHQIDRLVYKLYDLTPEEIKIIEAK